MKSTAEKSSTSSKAIARPASQPFFAKTVSGNFLSALQQSRLVIEDGKRLFRTGSGQFVELPDDISLDEAVKMETDAKAAEQKLGKGPPPKPLPDIKKLAKTEAKKTSPKAGKGKSATSKQGNVGNKSTGAAVAGLKAVGTSKVAQYLAFKGSPALVKGYGALQTLKVNEQTHASASEKLRQTQKAVVIPPGEGQSKSNAGQVVTVSDRPPPVADENKGKQKLQLSLRENVPKTIEDVDNFQRDKKAQHMGADVLSVVQTDKSAVVSAFDEMEQTPPPLPPEHTPENLPPEEMAPTTGVMNLGQGAIAPLEKEHTDVGNYTKEADGKLKEEGITQEQLDMVDSGDLAEANKEKKGMETKAKTEPQAVQNFVRQSAARVDVELKQEEKKERDAMKAKRKSGLGATTQKQKSTQSALEKKREEVANKINDIYTRAQTGVKKKLADLETVSMKRFDDGNANAAKAFEDNVNREIDAYKDDRYSGWFGWARKAKDWLLGMDDLPAVKAIFDRNRATFVDTVNKLVEDISADNKRVIQECKNELAVAKQQIKDYVDKLGPELKDIGQKSADEMNGKLTEMDGFIGKKEQELQNKLKDKQQAAIKAIDEKIEKMKEAMAGALAKLGKLLLLAAKKFFTWALEKAGFSLADIEGIINKGVTVLKAIFTKPIVFVKNLINAAIDGFKNFGKHFLKHLQDALFEWLTGALEGIILPQTWDFKGIVGVALQMIGISYQNIRKHLVDAIGEPVVAGLEKTFTLVKTLVTEGPMAAWEQLKEMATDMKEAFVAAVKDFVKVKIIEQAIQWVISIFVPGAGIVKAIIGIYDTIMFFIEKAKQIMQMVGNFLSAVGDIAAGNIGAAADALENGLARGLTLVIGFLASLLRLGGITSKIKEAIQKIRTKVDAVLTKVAKWIAEKASKLFGAVKSGVKSILSWLGIKKHFKADNGESHEMYFKGTEDAAQLYMASSNPQVYTAWVKGIVLEKNPTTEAAKKRALLKSKALAKAVEIDILKAKKEVPPITAESKKQDLEKLIDELTALTGPLLVGNTDKPDCASEANDHLRFQGKKPKGYGVGMTARGLTNKNMPKGSVPNPPQNDSYEIINQRRYGAGSYYVKGHLLNDNLGGTGTDWKNLTPLTGTTNTALHERQVESFVKKAVDEGNVVDYKVKPKYDRADNRRNLKRAVNNSDTEFDTDVINEIIDHELFVPTALDCSADLVNPSTGKTVVLVSKIIPNIIDQTPTSYALVGKKRKIVFLESSTVAQIGKTLDDLDVAVIQKIKSAFKLKYKETETRFKAYADLRDYKVDGKLFFNKKERDIIDKLQQKTYVKLY